MSSPSEDKLIRDFTKIIQSAVSALTYDEARYREDEQPTLFDVFTPNDKEDFSHVHEPTMLSFDFKFDDNDSLLLNKCDKKDSAYELCEQRPPDGVGAELQRVEDCADEITKAWKSAAKS